MTMWLVKVCRTHLGGPHSRAMTMELFEFLPHLPRRVLDELPGDAAGAGAAGCRPGERPGVKIVRPQTKMRGIGVDHREIVVLAAVVEAEPQPEAVGERDLLLHGLGRVDRGGALVLHHLAR